MVSEEIDFNHALEAAGIQVVETDLGEYIVQLRGERPSHILTPAVHLRRGQVGQLFHDKLGTPYTEDIPEMVATARRVLREVFLTADIGVSGVNFGVAETGTLCLVTNEGNGRMVTSLPPVHVALMGIERLVPTLDDLALFLSLLPRSGTGQKLSVYTSLIHAPKRLTDVDGPPERHLILVDNGRSAMRNSPLAESLYCIRCGACLNACPVFREIGGHAYIGLDGSIAPYPGPIGSVVSPGLLGCGNFGQLAQASSLCGACQEACPVDINLPELLLRVRAGEAVEKTRNKKQGEGVAVPGMLKLGLTGLPPGCQEPVAVLAWPAHWRPLQPGTLPTKEIYAHSRPGPAGAIQQGFSTPGSASLPGALERNPASRCNPSVKAGLRPEIEPVLTDISRAPSLADQFTDELAEIGVKVYRLAEKEVPARLAEFLHERGVERVCVDNIGEKYATGIPFTRDPDPTIRVRCYRRFGRDCRYRLVGTGRRRRPATDRLPAAGYSHCHSTGIGPRANIIGCTWQAGNSDCLGRGHHHRSQPHRRYRNDPLHRGARTKRTARFFDRLMCRSTLLQPVTDPDIAEFPALVDLIGPIDAVDHHSRQSR